MVGRLFRKIFSVRVKVKLEKQFYRFENLASTKKLIIKKKVEIWKEQLISSNRQTQIIRIQLIKCRNRWVRNLRLNHHRNRRICWDRNIDMETMSQKLKIICKRQIKNFLDRHKSNFFKKTQMHLQMTILKAFLRNLLKLIKIDRDR